MVSFFLSLGLVSVVGVHEANEPIDVCAELQVDYYHFEKGNSSEGSYALQKPLDLSKPQDQYMLRMAMGSTMFFVRFHSEQREGFLDLNADVIEARTMKHPAGFDLSIAPDSDFQLISSQAGEVEFNYQNEDGEPVREYYLARFQVQPNNGSCD